MTLLAGMLAVYAVCVTLWGWEQRREATDARERLLQAWKDGYQIPEPIAVPIDPEPEGPEFAPVLEDWLTQWEGEEARERWRRRIRVLVAKYGGDMKKILHDLESPLYG